MTTAAAHVMEALFAVQSARRSLAHGRGVLGPVRGADAAWRRLDALVATTDAMLAELEEVGRGELALHPSHSGIGCELCSPRGSR